MPDIHAEAHAQTEGKKMSTATSTVSGPILPLLKTLVMARNALGDEDLLSHLPTPQSPLLWPTWQPCLASLSSIPQTQHFFYQLAASPLQHQIENNTKPFVTHAFTCTSKQTLATHKQTATSLQSIRHTHRVQPPQSTPPHPHRTHLRRPGEGLAAWPT